MSTRKRSARSSSARSARLRLAADERQDGVDAVVEEVRADARLQRLDARLARWPATGRARAGRSRRGSRRSRRATKNARRPNGRRRLVREAVAPKTVTQPQASASSRAATTARAAGVGAARAASRRAGAQQEQGDDEDRLGDRGADEELPGRRPRRGAARSTAAASTKRFAMTSDAQHHAEVAEVRQPDARTRLIYTRHAAILPDAADSMQHEDSENRRAGARQGLVRPLRRARRPAHPALHRLRLVRPAPRRVRHPGLARPRPHARALRHPARRPTSRPSSAAWRRSPPRSARGASSGRSPARTSTSTSSTG